MTFGDLSSPFSIKQVATMLKTRCRISSYFEQVEKKFGEWINFGHKDTIYKLKFGWLQLAEDSPNLSNLPAAKNSCYAVASFSKIFNLYHFSLMQNIDLRKI